MSNDGAPRMILCPHCGQYHPAEVKFCPLTGMSLAPAIPVCPNCGRDVKPEWVRCPYCATPLRNQSGLVQPPQRRTTRQAWWLIPLVIIGIAGLAWVATQLPRNLNSLEDGAKTPLSETAVLLGEDDLSDPILTIPLATSPPPAIPSSTPTETATVTSSSTPTQTNTPTPTLTATLTPIMSIAAGLWEACPGTYLSRLYVGDHAYVSYYPPLSSRVRSEAGTDGRILGQIDPGEEVQVLDGPACENGWVWWKIRSQETNLTGWTAEGDREDYWLVPLPRLAEIEPSIDDETVQIGFDDSIYLRFDPGDWEAINEFGAQTQYNYNDEAIYALQNLSFQGCVLHGNLGFGPPTTWQRQDGSLMIGNLEYRVETWTEMASQMPVLVVYQYPAGRSGTGLRIELKIEQEPEECIRDAIKVLALSEELIMVNVP